MILGQVEFLAGAAAVGVERFAAGRGIVKPFVRGGKRRWALAFSIRFQELET
ncbi:hypothetical protein VDG1235_371 [Verrucomicrobiia bacterium DG1235]|nr:hypothetical protein VDG1235_371 [Verrucomicrobiae bacterium DG1235]